MLELSELIKAGAHKAMAGSPIFQLDGNSEKVTYKDKPDFEIEDIILEISDEEHSFDRCDFVGETPADLNTHQKAKHLFGRYKGFS